MSTVSTIRKMTPVIASTTKARSRMAAAGGDAGSKIDKFSVTCPALASRIIPPIGSHSVFAHCGTRTALRYETGGAASKEKSMRRRIFVIEDFSNRSRKLSLAINSSQAKACDYGFDASEHKAGHFDLMS